MPLIESGLGGFKKEAWRTGRKIRGL